MSIEHIVAEIEYVANFWHDSEFGLTRWYLLTQKGLRNNGSWQDQALFMCEEVTSMRQTLEEMMKPFTLITNENRKDVIYLHYDHMSNLKFSDSIDIRNVIYEICNYYDCLRGIESGDENFYYNNPRTFYSKFRNVDF
jgi:hypothetical protein